MAKPTKKGARRAPKRANVWRSALSDLRALCEMLECGKPIDAPFAFRTGTLAGLRARP